MSAALARTCCFPVAKKNRPAARTTVSPAGRIPSFASRSENHRAASDESDAAFSSWPRHERRGIEVMSPREKLALALIAMPCIVWLLILPDSERVRTVVGISLMVNFWGYVLWRPRPNARERLVLALLTVPCIGLVIVVPESERIYSVAMISMAVNFWGYVVWGSSRR
jgi:hypothetical protein